MTETRRRRLRALRHLPLARHPSEVDAAMTALVRELHGVLHPDDVDVLRAHLLAGDTGAAASLIVGESRAAVVPPWQLALAVAGVLGSVVGAFALVVLAIRGQLLAFGVVYASIAVVARTPGVLFRSRWGCLPRRHAAMVRDAVELGAFATALAHYRAVRSIALADDEGCAAWGEAHSALARRRLGDDVARELARDRAIWEVVHATTFAGRVAAMRVVRERR